MSLAIGCFVQSTSNALGIGKLKDFSAERAIVEYFESPAQCEQIQHEVPPRSLKAVELEPEVRVYFENRETFAWQVGRILDYQKSDRMYLVRFPNDERRMIHESHLVTRWLKPIADPTDHLALQLNETPYWYHGRSAFIHSVYSQRRACGGMPAVLSSAIDLVEHQISVVRQVLQDPFQRYLLADEVGLGKTIEAGLLIRQFVWDESESHRVIVIVPTTLIQQWKSELSQRFHLSDHLGKTVHVIGNRDQTAIEQFGIHANMIVVDEAHHVASWAQSSDRISVSLFQSIARITESPERRVLLLSATPVLHNESAFLAMLHLIDPIVHSLDDIDSFRERVKRRQEVAESMASLTEDESNYFLGRTLNELSSFFPEDERFHELQRQLLELVEKDVCEDDADRCRLIKALRSHIGETWRLHRRLIRNRRSDSTDVYLPGRGGSVKVSFDDAHASIVEGLVSEWRLIAAKYLYDIVDSDVRHATGQLVRVFNEALVCDPKSLSTLASQRLGVIKSDKLELFDTEIGAIRDVPLFEGEREILDRICRNAERFDEIARLRCLESTIAQFAASNDQRTSAIVVFTNYPSTADRVYAFLCDQLGEARVLRHDPENSRWTRFLGTSENLVLVCDRRAEEGLNLRNRRSIAIHYDLPLSANRIEQRIGRLDRFGAGRRIQSYVLVATDERVQNEWFRCLDQGLNVFSRSVASLQYVIEAEFHRVWSEFIDSGADAFSEATQRLGGDEGAIENEFRRIYAQDALDAFGVDNFAENEFVETLQNFDVKATEFKQHLDEWLVQCLHFRLSGEERRRDDVVRYQFCRRNDLRPRKGEKDTLMSQRDFVRRFKSAIETDEVEPPVKAETKLIAFDRQTSQKRETGLARIGNPLIDAVEDYIRWDDRGICFAMWRYRPLASVDDQTQLFFRFDLIAEADQTPLRKLLIDWPEVSIAAMRRRADMTFPPIVGTLWLNSELERITDVEQLQLLTEPYRRDSIRGQSNAGQDFNLSQDRWSKANNICDITVWRGLCYSAREKAEFILREQTNMADVIRGCKAKAMAAAIDRIGQFESRLSRMDGDGVMTLHRELEFERAFSDAVQSAIGAPSVRVDSIGAVFLSQINPFGNESTRKEED